ncbi:MAG: hypothetical protein IPJ97_05710 [Proteobacteria bacterium]|nr:hypothetical protein [Pseudomonadota bacterium]
MNDIFALQDEISRAIVAALKLTLLPEEKRALEQRATTNVKAYKFYLMARQFSVMGNERHQDANLRCNSTRIHTKATGLQACAAWPCAATTTRSDISRRPRRSSIPSSPPRASRRSAMKPKVMPQVRSWRRGVR